jgi:hypothetical protein
MCRTGLSCPSLQPLYCLEIVRGPLYVLVCALIAKQGVAFGYCSVTCSEF